MDRKGPINAIDLIITIIRNKILVNNIYEKNIASNIYEYT